MLQVWEDKMIVSFETKSSPTLERFLEDFKSPKSFFIELLHNLVFTEKKITRIRDIVVIEQESLLNVFGRYSMVPSAGLIILGLILQANWMLMMGSVFFVMAMILLSKHFLLLTMMIKLKIAGHKSKIDYVSDGFLLSLLLMEYKNGTTRSVRNIKK